MTVIAKQAMTVIAKQAMTVIAKQAEPGIVARRNLLSLRGDAESVPEAN